MALSARLNRNNTAAALAALIFTGAVRAEFAANPDKPAPAMERGAWTLEPWGNSGAVERTNIDGRKYLKLIFSADKKDKTVFKHLTTLGLNKDGKIRFYVYASEEKPPNVAMAISTTRAYRWHESRQTPLKKGWNKIEYPIGGGNWKTAESKWEYTAAVDPADDVRAINIIIYNGNTTGALLVEGLTCDPDERGKKIEVLVKDLKSDDPETRGKAEMELIKIGRPALEALYQVADDERPEVLLRAASAMRKIEDTPEEMPADPVLRTEIEKQREEQTFDEARRRAEYALRGLEAQRLRLLSLFQETGAELKLGRAGLENLKHIDAEKRALFVNTLDRMEVVLKEIQPLLDTATGDKQKTETAEKPIPTKVEKNEKIEKSPGKDGKPVMEKDKMEMEKMEKQ
jgi:hypothetical protein